MDIAMQLRLLQEAEGDPAKLALATVDVAFPELSETERMTLRETLEVAAIPHWCDPAILSALMDVGVDESRARHARLFRLTLIEPFPARGADSFNVHEATRL